MINYQEKWQYTSDSGSAGGKSQYDYSYLPDDVENTCTLLKNGIEEIENQLKIIDNVAKAIGESGITWKGEDATIYIENMKKYEDDIRNLNKAYQAAIDTLTSTTAIVTDAGNRVAQAAVQELGLN